MGKATETTRYLDRDATLGVQATLDVIDGRDAVYVSAMARVDKPIPITTNVVVTLDPAAVVRLLRSLAELAQGNGWIAGYEITNAS